jgi:cobalt/nickel transport system permease protein
MSAGVRERLWLVLYAAAVLAATLIHEPLWLGGGLLLVLLLAGRDVLAVLRRALLAVLAFNLLVSVSYAVIELLRDASPWGYVLLINLRVLLIASLTVLLLRRINPLRALSFAPALSYLLGLAYGQILGFQRLYAEMRLALASRTLRPLSLPTLYRHGAASGSFFIEKALGRATETSLAMRSRGYFDD